MQAVYKDGVEYILDVAHNPEAAEYLSEQLRTKPVKGRTLMVLGMLADKDIDEVLNHLKSAVDSWYLAGLDVPRGQTAEALGKKLKQQGVAVTPVSAYDTVRIALNTVKADANPDDRVVVAGSFFTVAEALTVLNMDDKNQ
jgi:dihydrofolate synthase/folylpolyglutamate synthase